MKPSILNEYNIRHSHGLLAGIQTPAIVKLPCVAGFPPKARGNDGFEGGYSFVQTWYRRVLNRH